VLRQKLIEIGSIVIGAIVLPLNLGLWDLLGLLRSDSDSRCAAKRDSYAPQENAATTVFAVSPHVTSQEYFFILL
jgi:hypothetical protein